MNRTTHSQVQTQPIERFKTRLMALVALTASGAVGLIAVHLYLLQQDWSVATPLMLLDRGFDVLLVSAMALASVGIGRVLVRWIGFAFDSTMGQAVLAWGLGAAVLSHA